MKFRLIHKVFSTVLSFLILFSTMSFMVEKHFCGNTLVDVAVFSEIQKCGMGMDLEEPSSETQLQSKSCCKDVVDVVEGQDDVTIKVFDDLETFQKHTLVAYTFTYLNLYQSLAKPIIPHKAYSPPNLVKDIQVLDETYLI